MNNQKIILIACLALFSCGLTVKAIDADKEITLDFTVGDDENYPNTPVPRWLLSQLSPEEYENARKKAWQEFYEKKSELIRIFEALNGQDTNSVKVIFPANFDNFAANMSPDFFDKFMGINNPQNFSPLWVIKLEHICSLDLSDNKLSESIWMQIGTSLKARKNLKSLKLCNLDGDIDNACKYLLPLISSETGLEELNLSNNNLSGVIKDIASAMKQNQSITCLDLSNAYLHDRGWHNFDPIGDMLRTNKTLVKLYIRNNYIEDDGAEVLGEALRDNSALMVFDLSNNNRYMSVHTLYKLMKTLSSKADYTQSDIDRYDCENNFVFKKYQVII